MKKPVLIGDSGGTATDWCYLHPDKGRRYFTTESYQPIHFSEEFSARMQAFWINQEIDPATEIRFFGAGFSLVHNHEWVQQHLHACGFSNTHIYSDLLAACIATCGDQPGTVGILGTGSVLALYDGKKTTETQGGLGYLLGDEGGGYAFGRMLLRAYLNHKLSDGLADWLSENIGNRQKVMQQVYGSEGKKWIGQLAGKVAQSPFGEELLEIHRSNIRDFVENHVQDSMDRIIAFVGTYAFENRFLLKQELARKGRELGDCLAKPIARLADYYEKTTVQ